MNNQIGIWLLILLSMHCGTTYAQINELNNKQVPQQILKLDGLVNKSRYNRPDSAIYYLHLMNRLALQVNDTNEIAYSYTFLGSLKKDIGQTDSAVFFFNKAIKEHEKMGFMRGIAGNYNNLGNVYRMQGNYAEAIGYYRLGKELFQQLDDELNVNNLVQNIAELYIQTKRYDDAEDELNAAQQYFDKAKNRTGQGFLLRSRSAIALQRGDTLLAVKHLNDAVSIFIQLKRDAEICRTKAELAELFLLQGNLDLAYKTAVEGLEMAQYLGLKKEKADFLLVLSTSCNGNCSNRLGWLSEAALLAEETGASNQLMKIYPLLANELSAQGAYKESANFLQKALIIKDSVFNVESQKTYVEMQVRFRVSEKEKQILEKERITERAEAETKQARSRSVLFVAVAIFSVVFLLMFIWRYRQKKMLSLRLSIALSERELLLKEIHHRVKNNLQIISSLLNIQKKSQHSSIDDIISQTQDRIQTMALVHENLYQTENFKDISATDYLQGLCAHFKSSYSLADRNIALIFESEPLSLTIDKLIPLGLILNEAFTNSIKYAFNTNGGSIRVALQKLENGQVKFEYSDNGRGLPPDFDSKQLKSIGMQLMHGLSKQLHAELSIIGDKGVKIWVTFTP